MKVRVQHSPEFTFFPPEWLNWIKEIATAIRSQLNYLDLIAFVLGGCSILIFLWIVLRRRKHYYENTLSEMSWSYEHEIEKIQRGHLHEIQKAEESILTFQSELKLAAAEYEEELQKQQELYAQQLTETERTHAQRVQKLEKRHVHIQHTADQSIFDLKKAINTLRSKQLREVEGFEAEVRRLKQDIAAIHQAHTKKIEESELEISDLRKQLHVLMYKV